MNIATLRIDQLSPGFMGTHSFSEAAVSMHSAVVEQDFAHGVLRGTQGIFMVVGILSEKHSEVLALAGF